MKPAFYIAIIFFCTVLNSASQSLAFAALNLSLEYNIPISAMIKANNNPSSALHFLSLSQLGEVTVS